MAKPMKVGDAKLWVYHHESGHDRQAAEDHSFCSQVMILVSLAACQAQLFNIILYLVVTIRAKPVKIGDAKLWVYDYESNYDCQAAENEFEFLSSD
jgi:hypothetical protein